MIVQADADKSGTIEEDEFLKVMKQKASKLSGDRKFLNTLQQEIKMFLQLNDMKKQHQRMGKGLLRILDQAAERVEQELKLHPEKKAILTEDVGKATYRALYDECWDLFSELIKREEELERRQTGIKKRQKQLEKTRKELKR